MICSIVFLRKRNFDGVISLSKKRNKIIGVIELVLGLSLVVAAAYICKYIYIQNRILKYGIISFLFFMAAFYLLNSFSYKDKASDEKENNIKINSIALINEENKIIKEWDILNEISLVVGRGTKAKEVDIDLDMSIHSSLIDNEHAVLNFASNNWYIEDLHSKNGIKIQKDDDYVYKISKDKPCILEKGDIVFIGKTKLLIQ